MNKFKLQNLNFRQQILTMFICFIGIMAPLGGYFTSTTSNEVLKKQLYAQGEQVAKTLARQSKLALLYESQYTAQEAVSVISGHPDIEVQEIRLLNGTPLYRSANYEPIDPLKLYMENNHITSYEYDDKWIFDVQVFTESDADESIETMTTDATQIQTLLGFVSVSLSKDSLYLLQRRTFNTNMLFAFAVGAAICLALLFLSRRITKPIEQLANTMERAENGDTSVRAHLKGQPEIAVMQHAFNTMMDVLEQRERELEIARDKAVENARIKAEFAANVTHELRTPMNAVLGMLDLLDGSSLNSRQHEYVGVAKNSAESLLTLIDDILDFSKAEAEKTVLRATDLDVRELVEDVVKLLASQALGKTLDIGYLIEPSITRKATLDRSRLQQILINLVGNAIKFTDQGEIAVLVTYSEPDQEQSNGQLCFKVTDTGVGIDEADQKTIFEAFTQADSSSTREYAGTGLGLTITKQAIHMMKGEIGVISEKGHGSTFWFSLPVASGLGSPPVQPKSIDKETLKRALVISNSNIIKQFINQNLLPFNLICDVGNDYREIIAHVNQQRTEGNHYDLILVDSAAFIKNKLQIETFLERYTSLYNITAVALVNPYHNVTLPDIFTSSIEKPLTKDSIHHLNELLSLASASVDRPSNTLSVDKTRNNTQSKDICVLVVDDNRVNQQVAVEMLKRIGISVDTAFDGRAALTSVINNKYDLVLMDCNMPVMDGYECTREIRKLEHGKETPIVAMTANNTATEQERCIDAGMDDFLSKPLRISVLQKLVRDWLHIDMDEHSSIDEVTIQPEDRLTSNTSVTSTYDAKMVDQLFETLGDTVYSMIEAFIEDTPIYIDSLRNALATKNAVQAREFAHTMKGSAANFGAYHLIESAKAIEGLAKENCLADCSPYVEALDRQFDMLKDDLHEHVLKGDQDENAQANSNHIILIVDDDRTLRLALGGIFSKEGFEITEATSGAQAIETCKRHIPDIILMDAMMQDIDGFKACTIIRELPGCATIPILMITSLDDEDAISKAFSSGATDFVTKPLHFTVLKERVSRLVKANKAGQKMRQMAYIDSLTNLPNRAKLMQELRVILDRANLHEKQAAVLFLDLDNFKNVNDTLGHNVGDLLLKVVAERLRNCVRETDFVARLGGDEFTIVLENIEDNDRIARVAQTICDSLSEPFVFLDKKMFTSSSIGIATYPEDGKDVNSLLKHADLAMFKAKKNKNHYVFYQAGMADEITKRIELEQDLRYAIDHNQLVLFCQPQIDINTNKLMAAEVLIRWQHPDRGLLGPGEFIPIAEESELIADLTRWVIKQAIVQINIWSRRGIALKLSVNLSGKDLSQSWQLIDYLRDQAALHNIKPELLELEITESILMGDPQQSRAEILQLKNLGFTVAIDDFGTGYSSLNYLKNLPVDSLKIDKSFIQEIEKSKEDQAIVKGIIALANSLGLKTVAEGVETEAQRALIAEFGCDVAQGFLISKPLPIEEFDQSYLAGRNSDNPPRLKLI